MDRDDLIEKAEESLPDGLENRLLLGDRNGSVYRWIIETMADFALSQMPDYEALVEQTRWIPCPANKPEQSGWYDVTIDGHVEKKCFLKDRGWIDGDGTTAYPSAYRQNPEPYKPNETKEG